MISIKNALKIFSPTNLGIKIAKATRFLAKELLPHGVTEAFRIKMVNPADSVQIKMKSCNATKQIAHDVFVEALDAKKANKHLVTGNLFGLTNLEGLDWKCMLYSPSLASGAVETCHQSLLGADEQLQLAMRTLNSQSYTGQMCKIGVN